MSDRSLYAAALAVALFACFTADHASAYCRMTTGSPPQIGNTGCVGDGEPLVWNTPCLSYAVDRRGSQWFESLAEIESLVEQSFAAWQDVDCDGASPNLIFKREQSSTCRRAQFNEQGTNVNTIAFLDPWKDPCAEPDDPGYDDFALAVTIVWHNTTTGEILDADMMINDQLTSRLNTGGPYADCPDSGCPPGGPGSPGDADLRSIVTHEAGHFIGIGHSDLPEATMFAEAARDSVNKRTLAPDDMAAVCDIYRPGNLDESCDATPMGGLQLNCETTATGNPISCDAAPAPSSGGCSSSTGRSPADAPWAALLAGLVGLTAMRRRSSRRDV